MARALTPRYQITEAIMAYIFNPISTYLSTQILSIAEHNKELLEAEFTGFNYRGENYAVTVGRRRWKPSELHKSLHVEMDLLLKQQARIHQETDYIRSYVAKVTNVAKTLAEYCALFPDSLHAELGRIIPACNLASDGLSQARINEILQFNQDGMALIKNRLLKNLLI